MTIKRRQFPALISTLGIFVGNAISRRAYGASSQPEGQNVPQRLDSGPSKDAKGPVSKHQRPNALYATDFGVGAGGDDTQRLQVAFTAANKLGVDLWFTDVTVNLPTDFHAPDDSRMHITRNTKFSGGRILNTTAIWDYYHGNSKGKDYNKAIPRVGGLYTRGDTYNIDAWQGQWSVNSTYWQCNDYEWAFYREWTQDSDAAPHGWPQATLATYGIVMPGNLDFAGALHAVTMVAAEGGSGWGENIIIGTGKSRTEPLASRVKWLCGLEIDMQPSVGTTIEGGAGLLINNFFAPLDFAGAAIVSDYGKGWQTGIYIGGLQAAGSLITVAHGTQGLTGIDLSGGQFTGAAIALSANNNITFKSFAGNKATILYGDNTGNLFVSGEGKALNIQDTSTTENVQIFSTANRKNGDTVDIHTGYGRIPATSAACMMVRANSMTSRSINAGGTINASGADYAEYEWKAAGCGTIRPGDIVGFDKNGKLTRIFTNAISFCVKSTNPNLVGGDDWHSTLGPRPTKPVLTPQTEWTGGNRPVQSKQTPQMPGGIGDLTARQAAWDQAWETYIKKRDAEISTYETGPLAQWQAATTTYDANLESLRVQVDRIAYCGKTPVNVMGASVGDFIIAVPAGIEIKGVAKSYANTTQEERDLFCVGRVRSILADGRAQIVVKPI